MHISLYIQRILLQQITAMQWGWVTSSWNISYEPLPTSADQSKHVTWLQNIYSTIQIQNE